MSMPRGWNPNQTNDGKAYLGPENIIWKNNVMTGIINRKVVETQVITNFHVIQNGRSLALGDIDDIVIMNQHRESQFQGQRYSFRGSGFSYGTGRGRGKSIGDIAFIYQGQPSIVFRQIEDPYGVARLAKAARRSMIQQKKNAEKEQILLQKEQERQRKLTEKVQNQRYKTENELICQTCQSSNPQDALFCNKCGSKLDTKYIDPNKGNGLPENKSYEVVEPNFLECLLPEYKIKINFPSTWTRRDDPFEHCKVVFQSPKESHSDQYLEGLGVAVDETLGNMTPQHFIEVNIAHMKKNISDFKLFESGPTTLSGLPAHQMVYLSNNMKTLLVATVRNNVFYWLMYNSEPESYLKFLSSAEQMISSFEFLD